MRLDPVLATGSYDIAYFAEHTSSSTRDLHQLYHSNSLEPRPAEPGGWSSGAKDRKRKKD
ncbi:hypothetical protein JZ751_016716 [Albula glossodonta]|uniref:Uncharacterized protein n=1 Tax=Albula glossodonta TaxID=121402 RepID=A0A8T2NQ53_9TELE|nr:hypothetical protein JZ751_016716 [Albula glossodonta]